MNKFIAAVGVGAVIIGVGVAGFTLTSALADAGDSTPAVLVQDDGEQAPDRPDGRPEGHRSHGLDTAAETIGISVDDLRAELEDGQTIAEVAEANGVDRQVVVDALVDASNERLDQKVEDGQLTAEEADERRSEAEERAAAKVDGEHMRGERGDQTPDDQSA